MHHTTRRMRRLAASLTFAAIAGGLALPLVATPAGAIQQTDTSRLQGGDRYSTAAAIAADTFPDGATSVVVATGETFADALAANGLAGALGAPVLLTLQDRLPQATADALAQLGAETVYLMGGTGAVSQAVEDELATEHTVERVQGQNRFETAAAAGAAIAATDDGNPLTSGDGLGETEDGVTAVLAYGLNFPDAVSGGAVAYAGRLPVLLTDTNAVPDATMAALEELGVEHVLLVGGTSVISASVKTALEGEGYTTERLAGNDRWATNAAVNEYAEAEPALAFDGPAAYLSTGSKFADALTGGPAAGANGAPLVLTASTSLPAPTRTYLQDNANAIDEIIALGGTAAIAAEVLSAAAEAAQVTDTEAFLVAPEEREIRQVSSSALNSDGARTYAASGLEPGAEYVVAILDAEAVEEGDPARFTSYSPSDEAATSIESVNGSQVGSAGGTETVQETATAEDDGTITFVVDATAFDEIVPVVYDDADGNGVLTLEDGQSTELFGIGGQTTWVPAEAASNAAGGSYQDIAVKVARPDDGFFIANVVVATLPQEQRADRTFYFENTDRFVDADGVATDGVITPSEFRSRLNAGDVLDVEYQQDLQSRFTIVTDVGLQIFGYEEGTTVATNAGLPELNGGDVWLMHFSGDVQVAPDASITLLASSRADGSGTRQELTLTNGTSTSSWTVSGSTITITVGQGVDAATVFYGKNTVVTGLTGVRSVADAADLTVDDLNDRVLEDNGPELMTSTSTCKVGNLSCSIQFNEPVDRETASDPRRYDTSPERNVVSALLGSDGRTVTFGFGARLEGSDQIRPKDEETATAANAVTDVNDQVAVQGFVTFV